MMIILRLVIVLGILFVGLLIVDLGLICLIAMLKRIVRHTVEARQYLLAIQGGRYLKQHHQSPK